MKSTITGSLHVKQNRYVLSEKKKKYVIEFVSGLLILLFLYTGLSKLMGHTFFLYTLSKSPLLSPFADFLSYTLPISEIILAVMLLSKKTQKAGLWVSLLLLSLFTIYLIYMVSFADKKPCSCGGVISKMSWKQHIFFNLFFVAVNLVAIRLQKGLQILKTKYSSTAAGSLQC